MMVMPSNHSSPWVHYWAGKYPGKIGWLFGPNALRKTKLRDWLPFALDNDAFTSWTKKVEWSESAYFSMLDAIKKTRRTPLWVLVPDVVTNRVATLEKWNHLAPRVAEYGWPLAFAAQDGMTGMDVPDGADVIFIGGSTEWKWKNAPVFCRDFPRVHIGRVNTLDRIWLCVDIGAESVDGTGWFRAGEDSWKLQKLNQFFEGKREMEMELQFIQ